MMSIYIETNGIMRYNENKSSAFLKKEGYIKFEIIGGLILNNDLS